MYKTVVKITRETQKKCGIKTVKYYNKKESRIGLWQKMSDVERQTGHSNIADDALKGIRKYCGKKPKDEGIFIIEKLTRDIFEHSKLLKAIELKRKQDIITMT